MQAYLEAKRTVDDRALNRRVLDQFVAALTARNGPVSVVELGAGVGTMLVRLATWGCLPERVSYRLVDRDAESITRARDLVPDELENAGYTVRWRDDRAAESATLVATRDSTGEFTGGNCRERDETPGPLEYTDAVPATATTSATASASATTTPTTLTITFTTADAFEIEAQADAVIAAAFLDLIDVPAALESIETLLEPGGVLYAPITFDGGTGFVPTDPLDRDIERCYHHHMDEIRDGGSSRAGRELLTTLRRRDWETLATGGSNWVVRPACGDHSGADEAGSPGSPGSHTTHYPASEQLVLEHILHTIDDALTAVPAVMTPFSTAEQEQWHDQRRTALESGMFGFVAHNLDVLARCGPTVSGQS
ncbi:homolog to S-adenosylmethionine-dependent methyltransferase [Natrialba magadii ATCC 43099]|uniref:Homolog to S-adenosylmethionine-dependent methyltransferase n=1 Tax=Natrialba magadii (strain ATCC 43099 / DSM 3394 / CCM 3739 / CIP 104546 / IAM 13178 / JCM 8861 / NBRC 102185 / NCIMB 2190 / MS3) TaxID=547559 RepID=D3STX2_NATMM|nr:homolog to S-adenosylmethionine-dependent methyltransferase [Natrialba magadii ATCC 43099]ELY28796.1 hypothetical protein C500_12660 [Natrialba magadii ATCC 43099]